jgi:hypothetical protein
MQKIIIVSDYMQHTKERDEKYERKTNYNEQYNLENLLVSCCHYLVVKLKSLTEQPICRARKFQRFVRFSL